jgi:uncharacterized cupin superfamily protein
MLSDRPKANVTLNQRSRNFQYIGQKEAKRHEIVHFIQQRAIRRPALSPNAFIKQSFFQCHSGARDMSIETVVDFSEATTPAERFKPAPEKILKGDPEQTVYNHYNSPCGQMSAGVWEGEVGQWKVNYTEHEYCEIVQGVSVLRDEEGNAKTLRAGDRFVIPAGFKGTWEVLEACRKIYVVFEQKA